ncbi:MAG: YggT family protein [Syntrophothermus sp.]
MNQDLVWLIRVVFSFYIWAIIIDVLLSWFPAVNHRHPLVSLLHSITEPLLAPIRRFMPMGGMGIDFSPVVAILILQLLESFLINMLLRGIR